MSTLRRHRAENGVRWLWVPAPVRNCALGGDDTSCYIRFMLTEIFGPFLMVW